MNASLLERLFSVAGKTVLITGGGGGIGRMLTRTFLEAGARVYITGRKVESLNAAHTALGAPERLGLLVGDLSKSDGVRAIVDGFRRAENKLHVLINNAGRTWGAPFDTFPDTAWQSVLAVNVQAPFSLAQGLLESLERAASDEDPARIINIGSVYAVTTEVTNAYSYAASKAALHQLTRVMARELAPRRVLVNAIAPGLFPSKMTDFVMKNDARRTDAVAAIPRRRAGTPEDIGGLALFLSSRASAFVTGAIVPLDGGTLISH